MSTAHLPRLTACVALIAAACATAAPREQSGQEEAEDGVSHRNGATILTGIALHQDQTSVLNALSGKVPNFRVQRHRGDCPEIVLRNSVNFRPGGRIAPHVYIDGTRATDTCILESLRTGDVERVEVYPQGFTTRPGYGTHAHGLILVFMRSA